MKKIFFLSFIVSLLFVSQSYSQWWTQGGNLIWPYGDIKINNNLRVDKNLFLIDTLKLSDSSKIYAEDKYTFMMGNVNFAGSEIYAEVPGMTNRSILKLNDQGIHLFDTGISPFTPTFSAGGSAGLYVGGYNGIWNIHPDGAFQYTHNDPYKLVTIKVGFGSPEGVEWADKGSIFLRADGGTGSTFYVKESDNSNTGWVAK